MANLRVWKPPTRIIKAMQRPVYNNENTLLNNTVSSAYLTEIFESFQGEGVWVGSRQLFVRFAGCHLRCAYCDTPNSLSRSPALQVVNADDPDIVRVIPNPVSGADLTGIVKGMTSDEGFHSIAITGGEPLLQADFLREWLPEIVAMGLGVYLETSGDLYDRFASIAHLIDYCAMDIKLPSATHQPPKWEEHSRFLQHALNASVSVHVKAVVSDSTTVEEIERVAEIIMARSNDVPLVLQPVTPIGDILKGVSLSRLRTLQRTALATLKDVRIIPQMHKFLGAL